MRDGWRPTLIFSDHRLFVDLIKPVLAEEGLAVVGQADFVQPGLAFLKSHRVEVVLLDQVMPPAKEDLIYARSGLATSYDVSLQAVVHIRQHYPQIKLILVTEDHDPYRCARFVRAGVHGIVCKPYSLKELRGVVRRVLKGVGLAVPAPLQQPLLAQLAQTTPVLTDQDVQVLRLVQLGLTNKAIAKKIGLRTNTIRNRVARLCKKLGVNTRLAAVARASEYGWLDVLY